jgi:hypothetical protein
MLESLRINVLLLDPVNPWWSMMRSCRRIFRLRRLWRQVSRRQLCALVLSTVYGALFCFATLCLATGLFHAGAQHHHTGHQHHHDGDDNDHRPLLPDLCDLALKTLWTTEWRAAPVPSAVLPSAPRPAPVAIPVLHTALILPADIRAPPAPLPSPV